MTPSRRADVAIVYLAGLAQGLALVTFPALSAIFTDPGGYGLTSSEYGGLFVPQVVLAIGGSSLGPRAARRHGLKPVFVGGLAFNLASMVLLAASAFAAPHGTRYGLLLAATTALGAGFGTTLMTLNTYVAEFFEQQTNVALPALHAFLGSGTALAPILVAVFAGGATWRRLPLIVAAAFLLLGLLSLRAPLAAAGPPPAPPTGRTPAPRPRIPTRLALYGAAVFLYGICETVFGNWATLYLHGEARMPLASAELALTAFWAVVTIGRIAAAVIAIRVDARLIYAALPVLIIAALLAIPTARGAGGNVLAFGFAGVACSAFFPLTISLAEQEFFQAAAGVSGGLVAAYMAGYGVAAFGVGPLRDSARVPLAAVYTGTAAVAAGLAGAAFVLARPVKRPA